MKPLRLLFAAALALAGSAKADLYTGSLCCTVNSTNDSRFDGAVFTGSYTYESDSLDGSFYGSALHGVILRPPLFNQSVGLDSTAYLTVTNGLVKDFYLDAGDGTTWGSFYSDNFTVVDYWSSTYARGTVTWTAPQRVTGVGVPDAGATAAMLVLGLLALVGYRRQERPGRSIAQASTR